MKQLLFSTLLIFLCLRINAQEIDRHRITINGYAGSKYPFEFSAMAQDENKVYLVPTMKKGQRPVIYTIPKAVLDVIIENKVPNVTIKDSIVFDVAAFNQVVAPNDNNYGGIEAIAVKGDDIWMLSEFKGNDCYIYKGRFTESGRTIKMLKNHKLPKPGAGSVIEEHRDNDGFESLVFFNNTLMAFYERKLSNGPATFACTIDTAITTITTVPFSAFTEERLSDIALTPDGMDLVGITMTYHQNDSAKNVYRIEKWAGNNRTHSNYMLLSSGRTDKVWEGIIPISDGYLLIDDNSNDGNPANATATVLEYISFKKPVPAPTAVTTPLVSSQKIHTLKLIDLWNRQPNSYTDSVEISEDYKLKIDSAGAADLTVNSIIRLHGNSIPKVISQNELSDSLYTASETANAFIFNFKANDGTVKDVKLVFYKKITPKTAQEKQNEEILATLKQIINNTSGKQPIGWFTLLKKNIDVYDTIGKIMTIPIKNIGIVVENGGIIKKGITVRFADSSSLIFKNQQAPISIYSLRKRLKDKLYVENDPRKLYVQVKDLFYYDYKGKFHYPDQDSVTLTPESPVDSVYNFTDFNDIIDVTVYTDLLALVGRKPNGIIQTQLSGNFITNTRNFYRNWNLILFNTVNPYFRLSKFDSKFVQLDSTIITKKDSIILRKVYLSQVSYLQAGLKANLFRVGFGPNQEILVNMSVDFNLTNADSLFNKDISFVNYTPEIQYRLHGMENFGLEVSCRWMIQQYSRNVPFKNREGITIFNPQVTAYYSPFSNKKARIYLRFSNFAEIDNGKYNFSQFQFGLKTTLFKDK